MNENEKPTGLKRFSTVNKEVARRWGRQWAIRKRKFLVRKLSKRRIVKDANENRNALVGAYDSILDAYRKAERLNFEHTMAVYRVALYLLTVNRDISSIKVDLLTSDDWWLRKLLARNVALMIYELDMQKVTGAKFRAAVNFFSPPKKLQRDLENCLSQLATVHASVKARLADIRHFTIAHRDADAMKQYRLIRNIDEIEVVKIAGEFFAAANPAVSLLAELALDSGGMHHLLNQYVGKKRFKKPKS